MSHQGSGSEHEDIDLRKTGYHAGFPRQGVPPQYQATDIVHQATSETPHHPSRPPNFLQPWRLEHHSGQVVLERTYTATPERTRDHSMGNKSASSANSDKGPAPVENTHAATVKDEIGRTAVDTKRGQTEVARGSHDGAESRVAREFSHPVVLPHSSAWHGLNVSHTQTQPSTSIAVPLVTPAALADMGHLYKLPTSATPSQPKIYSSGIFNPLYTLTPTTALQYSSYVSPSTVTYSPYISGYPVSYPVVAQGSVGSGPYTTVESYSAMLASMGSQVQQAQGAQVPVSNYLPSGVIQTVPLPYGSQLTHEITNLSLLTKSSGQDSVPTVGYLNQQVPTAPGILPSGQVFTGIVPLGGSLLTLPPRTEREPNRPEPSPGKEQEHNQSANLRNVKTEKDERNMHQEAEALPFLRQTYSIQPENPHSRSILKAAPAVSAPTVEYLDRQAYHETSTRHESVIMTVTIPSDKSRQTGAKDTNPVYAAGEPQQWGAASYNQPTDNQGAVSYHPAPSSSVQHSPQVRFHLSPSPQARPSPTISHVPSADSQDVEFVPMPSDPRTHSVPPAASVDHRPSQTQEVMVHTSALEPDRPPMHSLMAAPQISAPSFSNIPSYFTRGSVIQLASGELKRVEDMRTEDFVHSADMCGGLKIDSSTVVRINEHVDNGVALISFLVGEHKAQVSLEAPMEHPFFVFGQGWSAVKPDRSLKSYSLGCHKLAVGDVCVSLTVKDKHGRWPPQPQQLEEPLLQHPPPPQQQQQQPPHKQLPQQIPVQSIFLGSSKETAPSWSSEPKRPKLEPVQEDCDWRGNTDPRPDMTWQRESPQQRSHPEPPPSSYTFAVPPPVSRSYMSTEQPHAKFTQGTDSNANTVLIRTTDTMAGGKADRPTPRSGKPLQPLKRRWSDPMHMAQLAADQERHANTTKPSDPH